jgi:protein O-GlcNAc transferase
MRQPLPRTITFQRKRANRRVVNEEALLAMLAEFGEVSFAVGTRSQRKF